MNCLFCDLENDSNHLFDTEHFFGVWDIDPVQQGHLLIIIKTHRMNISELNSKELIEMVHIHKELTRIFEKIDDVLGVTTLYNNGKVMMDKTHFHFHIIPRYKNDGFYDSLVVQQKSIDKLSLERKFTNISFDF